MEDPNVRLSFLENFLNVICIEGGCGFDLKVICHHIISGNYDYSQAIEAWKRLGHVFLVDEDRLSSGC